MENISKVSTTQSLDLSNMSDKELRDAINRMSLEKQYTNLYVDATNSDSTGIGKEAVLETLSVAGSVLTVASSAVALALALRQFK